VGFGETPGGIFTYPEKNQRFYSWKGNERTSRSVEVSERCGKKRRETSSPVSTKRLPQCVCSILSISKAGPPFHSCVVVCSYLAQPYPRTSRTTVQLVFLYIAVVGALTDVCPCNGSGLSVHYPSSLSRALGNYPEASFPRTFNFFLCTSIPQMQRSTRMETWSKCRYIRL
jgi:hypothetical protein